MPRGASDVVDVVPPTIGDAYAVADNRYRVVFDRDVTTATATDLANYSLASFGTVTSATMDGPGAVLLDVTSPLTHGQLETVTVNGITGLANGVTMTTPASSSFIFGVLSCGEMSAPDPDSLAGNPCRDRSRYAGPLGQYINGQFGPRSTLTGIVVGVYGNLYYMEDSDPANNRGITVFAPPIALTVGHRYIIAGADEEYYSENEFAAIVYIQDVGVPGVPAPVLRPVATVALDTCDAAQNITSGRDYLADLVKLENVKVVQRFETLPTTGFDVARPPPGLAGHHLRREPEPGARPVLDLQPQLPGRQLADRRGGLRALHDQHQHAELPRLSAFGRGHHGQGPAGGGRPGGGATVARCDPEPRPPRERQLHPAAHGRRAAGRLRPGRAARHAAGLRQDGGRIAPADLEWPGRRRESRAPGDVLLPPAGR